MRSWHSPTLLRGLAGTARFGAACCLLTALVPKTPAAPDGGARFAAVQTRLVGEIAGLLGGEVRTYAVSVLDPHSGLRVRVNADHVFPAASTMKIGILLTLYRRAARGQLNLSERVDVRNSFRSVADGSRYAVPEEMSPDCACLTYRSKRRSVPLRDVALDMIQSSSNLATNALIRRVGTRVIQHELGLMGLRGIHIVRGLYDMKAFEREIHNTLTADSAMRAFHILRRPEFFGWKERSEMLQILAQTEHRDKIPTLLPAGVIVSQKSGYTEDVSHDAGLVYPEPNRPYALAILTEGHRDRHVLEERMARISRLVYDAVVELRRP